MNNKTPPTPSEDSAGSGGWTIERVDKLIEDLDKDKMSEKEVAMFLEMDQALKESIFYSAQFTIYKDAVTEAKADFERIQYTTKEMITAIKAKDARTKLEELQGGCDE